MRDRSTFMRGSSHLQSWPVPHRGTGSVATERPRAARIAPLGHEPTAPFRTLPNSFVHSTHGHGAAFGLRRVSVLISARGAAGWSRAPIGWSSVSAMSMVLDCLRRTTFPLAKASEAHLSDDAAARRAPGGRWNRANPSELNKTRWFSRHYWRPRVSPFRLI